MTGNTTLDIGASIGYDAFNARRGVGQDWEKRLMYIDSLHFFLPFLGVLAVALVAVISAWWAR